MDWQHLLDHLSQAFGHGSHFTDFNSMVNALAHSGIDVSTLSAHDLHEFFQIFNTSHTDVADHVTSTGGHVAGLRFEGYGHSAADLSSLDVLHPSVGLVAQRSFLQDLIDEHGSLFAHLRSAIGGSSQEVASAMQHIEESLGPKAFAATKAAIKFRGSG
jgi:hypothetical protein